MATRSMIAILNANGSVTASYCHYDGYVDGVGATLDQYYADPALARAVAECGYLSALGENLTASLEAAAHKNEVTVPYTDVEQYLKNGADYAGAEYLYLFDGEAWFVAEVYGTEKRFTDVKTILSENDEKVA